MLGGHGHFENMQLCLVYTPPLHSLITSQPLPIVDVLISGASVFIITLHKSGNQTRGAEADGRALCFLAKQICDH